MATTKTPISEAIYYNYLQTIEKLKHQYEAVGQVTPEVLQQIKLRAHTMNRELIEKIFTYTHTNPNDPFFNIFTREGNSRNNILNLVNGNPYAVSRGLTLEFMGRKPQNDKEATLRNAIEATNNNYDVDKACEGVRNVILKGEYGHFTRRVNGQGADINYREDLKRNVSPAEISDVFLNSIINEHEKGFQISDTLGKIKDSVSTGIEAAGNKVATGLEEFAEKLRKVVKQKHPEVDNVQVHQNSKSLIMATDPLWKFQRGVDVSLGKGLHASTDIGNVRQNQEDSVLIMYHPQNPDFKMLVVSDGMGGLDNGEVASSYVVECMQRWFNALPPQYFDKRNTQALKEGYEQAIKAVSKSLHQRNQSSNVRGESGATFCGAIVTEKETIISNVGDSRAYAYSKGKLTQQTKDDSMVFDMYLKDIEGKQIDENEKMQLKDAIRFNPYSNIIKQAMGLEDDVTPRSTVIKNSSYDCLILVSDGVSDCLSDEQIKAITKDTPRDKLAQMLIQEAKARDSVSKDGTRRIRAGKDNATVALYDRNER